MSRVATKLDHMHGCDKDHSRRIHVQNSGSVPWTGDQGPGFKKQPQLILVYMATL